MIVKLLTEFLSLKGGCTGLSESTLVKMPHCWKSHALAQIGLWNLWLIYMFKHSLTSITSYLMLLQFQQQ